MITIRPCPFCGARPKLVLFQGWLFLRCQTTTHNAESARFWWHMGYEKAFWKNKARAIGAAVKSWNIRG